jgi:aldose 1-epimerase
LSVLELESARASVTIDPERGGRLASLTVDGLPLLFQGDETGPLQWGSYPMIPWAGRVRHGRFSFAGTDHQLPCNLPPHSAHGVAFTSAWEVIDAQTIAVDLGSPWPFGGRVVQRFELTDSDLKITVEVEATEDMPLMVGWHPWFNRYLPGQDGPVEAELNLGPAMMYELDETAIPTGQLVTPPPGPWDNCFVSLAHPPRVRWADLVSVELTSSCKHWVVYTEPEHALCVEPQSDAPDAFNRHPLVVAAGGVHQEWMRYRWS